MIEPIPIQAAVGGTELPPCPPCEEGDCACDFMCACTCGRCAE